MPSRPQEKAIGLIQRPNIRGRSLFTKAEEAVPWRIPEFKELTMPATGLILSMAYGPRNGRCLTGTTVGLCHTNPLDLAALLGKPIEMIEGTLDELVSKGWILVNREQDLIVIPPFITPADNAKHFHGIISSAAEKLPDCSETIVYMRLMSERTKQASKNWKKDGEAVEDLWRDLYRLFPELQNDDFFDD